MIWPFGAEHWCNLEGTYLHIVSDMSHLKWFEYETSICSLGVIGTRYVRDGDSLPAEITLTSGESQSFSLAHIYSEIEIGTRLAINVREKSGLSWVQITNEEDWTNISIDAPGMELDGRFEVVLESFNTLSDV